MDKLPCTFLGLISVCMSAHQSKIRASWACVFYREPALCHLFLFIKHHSQLGLCVVEGTLSPWLRTPKQSPLGQCQGTGRSWSASSRSCEAPWSRWRPPMVGRRLRTCAPSWERRRCRPAPGESKLGPNGHGSKPMVPCWDRFTTHSSLFCGDWDVHWG